MKEGHIEYAGGLKIRYRLNEHGKDIPVLLLHGAGHRLEEYDSMYPYFDAEDIALSAVELRGHGLSGGTKLHIESFNDYVTDVKRFVFGVLRNKPVYIIAEGSSVITAILAAGDPRLAIRGIAALSPAMISGVPLFPRAKIALAAKFFPLLRLGPAKKSVKPAAENASLAGEPQITRFTSSYYNALIKGTSAAVKTIPSLIDMPSFIVSDGSPISHTVENFFRQVYRQSQKLSITEIKKDNIGMLHGKDRIEIIEKISRWIRRQENLS